MMSATRVIQLRPVRLFSAPGFMTDLQVGTRRYRMARRDLVALVRRVLDSFELGRPLSDVRGVLQVTPLEDGGLRVGILEATADLSAIQLSHFLQSLELRILSL